MNRLQYLFKPGSVAVVGASDVEVADRCRKGQRNTERALRAALERVPGIDVILCGHTHDALPEPLMVGSTALIASAPSRR